MLHEIALERAQKPSWPTATAPQRAQYQFISDSSTGLYSDGTAGQKVF